MVYLTFLRGTKNSIILPTDNFRRVSDLLKNAYLNISDFDESINTATLGDIIFADPPYTVTHNKNGFIKYNQTIFSWDDQIRLSSSLVKAANRGAYIVVTNADHPDVAELYKDIPYHHSIDRQSVIAASSDNRKPTTELLVTNFDFMSFKNNNRRIIGSKYSDRVQSGS